MNHSYEEIRKAAIQYLTGLDSGSEYGAFKTGIGRVLASAEQTASNTNGRMQLHYSGSNSLSPHDRDLALEVFWGLFREGIITLGSDDLNPKFPWFRVSEFGRRVLKNQDPYFFHDVSTYESLIKSRVPDIDPVTLIYLKEAVQAFKTGCVLSSSVMIGVAIEHSFLKLLDVIESNGTHAAMFKKALSERTILRKLNAFKSVLDGNQQLLPPQVKEDLDTQFMSAAAMIRNFRNESGHPSGKIISREQCYLLLQVFIPCCEKIYQLIGIFK